MSVTLILGGARSGKSKRAESYARNSGKRVIYIATAPRIEDDDEWMQRLAQHRNSRPAHWQTVEEQLNLASVLQKSTADELLLIDCATLWLSNLMWAEKDVASEVAQFCAILSQTKSDVILVSNELGMGLVPETALGRAFRDAQGRMNQQLAGIADCVEFIAAGLPITLKGEKQ